MSNDVYLVGGNEPGPARPLPDGTYTYDFYGTETLAGCTAGIPVLWVFCFDAGSFLIYDASDLSSSPWTVASAVIETNRARQLLAARQPLLQRWPGASAYFDEFAEQIRDCGFRYLKLDLLELDMMVEQGIADPFRRTLRWFDSGSSSDRVALDSLVYFDHTDSDAATLARGWTITS